MNYTSHSEYNAFQACLSTCNTRKVQEFYISVKTLPNTTCDRLLHHGNCSVYILDEY